MKITIRNEQKEEKEREIELYLSDEGGQIRVRATGEDGGFDYCLAEFKVSDEGRLYIEIPTGVRDERIATEGTCYHTLVKKASF